ncbi:hypothetical protein [Heyndrickxia ginsengihumi]|uniref:Cytosolic protein n=1 Tax=Heyndrickxia ginsengihumi TaxID=363870 RepID=A0A0A6VCR4_9BACI|nr:hypothetical protein [Heyndrickxia ginsengihumi]KHD86095.1 cytosolic protein [Heyndrickxia ginsengihumi]MBE6185446.1 cytosolic protein [Bacillus sp. (in: firmicutes)]MCM3023410.1 cytosolic protein [Heyndrickxia ginsengihumi]NEY21557.1 cytosolic protein [Heyndrickxia ginsengihumi]
MKSFTVSFHHEDNVDTMQVQKLSQAEFEQSTAGGTRLLFELDTNIGFFVFFDAEDNDGDISYLVLRYEEDNEEPSDCISFELKDYYELVALYLSGSMNMNEEENEEEEYGPIHHLAHLLFHIIEEGKEVTP